MLLPLDPQQEPLATWCLALAATPAAPLLGLLPRLERIFALGSTWAPGFVFIGAQAAGQDADGALHRFSLAGGGLDPVAALTACLGEGMERLATVSRPGDVAETATCADVSARLWTPARADVAAMSAADAAYDWMTATAVPDGSQVLVPADWVIRSLRSPATLRPPGVALSTGVAAGPDLGFATERALLELIERDAIALWWRGGRRARPFALEMGAEAVATELLRELRHTESRRATWLLDLTTDMSVPTVAAVSVDAQDGRLFAIGFSARRALRNAVEGALLELCQTELALHLALAKRQSGGPSACSAADLITLQRAESIDAHCALLRPLGAPRAGDDAADAPLPEWLSARGIDVALVELTRADLDAVVVRALAPALQAYPGGRVTMRLSDVSRDTGGGDRLSGGVPLM